MSGGGGAGAVIDPSILGGAGESIGGGWMAAPGMADAGYGLPDPSQGPDSWFQRNIGNISNKDLSTALTGLGKAGSAGAAAGKGAGPVMPSTGGGGGGAGVGRGGGVSLTQLLQLLNQRRDLLLQSATGGVGAGAPQGARPTAGLLGF